MFDEFNSTKDFAGRMFYQTIQIDICYHSNKHSRHIDICYHSNKHSRHIDICYHSNLDTEEETLLP